MTELGRARNDYTCDHCDRIIKKGEVYERFQKIRPRPLKGYSNLKLCKTCSIARSSIPELLKGYYDRLESKYAHLQTSNH